MRHFYHSEQWLPHPVNQVFAFFANPENLPRLTPHWQKARIEEATFAPPPPRPGPADPAPRTKSIAAGIGTRLTLSFKPFPFSPIRISWEAEIIEFAWNQHFSDRQIRGPFAYWNHCHSVDPETRTIEVGAVNGTLLRDDVEYEMPLGKLGDLTQRLLISGQIRNAFSYRRNRTRDLLARI